MARSGYAIVVVDRPGTGASFGQLDLSPATGAKKANEILNWIAAQKWCDGNIRMFGDHVVSNRAERSMQENLAKVSFSGNLRKVQVHGEAANMDSQSELKRDQPAIYQIRVQGWIGSERSDWFHGFALTTEEEPGSPIVTTLCGSVADQAALLGLLQKLYTLGFPILLVCYVEMGAQAPSNVTR